MDTPELVSAEWLLHYRYAVQEGMDSIQAKKVADLMMQEMLTRQVQ